MIDEDDIYEYNQWLANIWSHDQLNIPDDLVEFISETPSAYIKYKEDKENCKYKDCLKAFLIGLEVDAVDKIIDATNPEYYRGLGKKYLKFIRQF